MRITVTSWVVNFTARSSNVSFSIPLLLELLDLAKNLLYIIKFEIKGDAMNLTVTFSKTTWFRI